MPLARCAAASNVRMVSPFFEATRDGACTGASRVASTDCSVRPARNPQISPPARTIAATEKDDDAHGQFHSVISPTAVVRSLGMQLWFRDQLAAAMRLLATRQTIAPDAMHPSGHVPRRRSEARPQSP